MTRLLKVPLLLVLLAATAFALAGCGEDIPEGPWGDAFTTAKEVRALLVAGGDWTELAKEYSDDPGSKDSGGALGTTTRGQWVKEFEEAAFSLKLNEISQPVKSSFGYHLIQVTAIVPEGQQTLEQVKDEIVATLLEQAKSARWSEWVEAAKLELGVAYRSDMQPAGVTTTTSPGAGAATLPTGVVARIGDAYIDGADFTLQVSAAAAQYGFTPVDQPELYAQLRADVLENVIETSLAVQKASGLGVTVSDAEVQAELESMLDTYFDGDQAALQSQLDLLGMTLDKLLGEYEAALFKRKVFTVVTGDITSVPDDQVTAYYEDNKDSYLVEEARTVRHILIEPVLDPRRRHFDHLH